MSRQFNHVAVSVTDIDMAASWYQNILGMTLLLGPVEISASSPPSPQSIAALVRQVFGPKLGKFKICHLSSSNGVGVELFQFIDPAAERRRQDSNFEYWKTGFFHIAVTEPNIEELANKISSTGGKRRTAVLDLEPGKSAKKICFCEDPFGNIIEIYSHSYEQFWANSAL
jgi:catechol 2,3-dioxygenase-like lactoylglutathione lyase family enzyme